MAVHILGRSFPLAGESRVIESDMIPPIPPRSPLHHDSGVLRKCDGPKDLIAGTKIEWIELFTAKGAKSAKGTDNE